MFKAVISILITISFLASLIGGICSEVHSESHCSTDAGCNCSGNTPSTPSLPSDSDHDHSEGGHCKDCSGCSCLRSVINDSITLRYIPLLATLTVNEPFSVFPEVFIPKFVPPERLS